jgi:hypothetical protein
MSADWLGSRVTGGVVSATIRAPPVGSTGAAVVVVAAAAVVVVSPGVVVPVLAVVVVSAPEVHAVATNANTRSRPRVLFLTLVSSGLSACVPARSAGSRDPPQMGERHR